MQRNSSFTKRKGLGEKRSERCPCGTKPDTSGWKLKEERTWSVRRGPRGHRADLRVGGGGGAAPAQEDAGRGAVAEVRKQCPFLRKDMKG